MKTASGDGSPASASGALPRTTRSDGTPSALGVRDDPRRRAARSRLDGDRPAGPVGTQPLDRDRPVARADVPQQLAGPRPEVRERDGADLALGELPVVVVGVVGQARHLGADRRTGVGDAGDGDDVQRVAGRVRPVAGGPVAPCARPDAPSWASTVIADPPYPASTSSPATALGVAAPSLSTSTRAPGASTRRTRGERPGDRADDLDPVDGPPEPRARQRHRRRVRDDVQPVRPEHAGEGGADAVEHRVAAGQHAHPPVRAARRTARAARAASARATGGCRPRCARRRGRAAAARPAAPRPPGRPRAPARRARPSRRRRCPRRSRSARVHRFARHRRSSRRRGLDTAPPARRSATRTNPAPAAARAQCRHPARRQATSARHGRGAVAPSRAASSASSATNHSWPPRFDSRTKSRSAVLPSTWSLTSPTTTSRSR